MLGSHDFAPSRQAERSAMTGNLARPAREEGSVSLVAVGVTLESRPAQDAVRNALALHSGLKERYPRVQERRAATVFVGPDRGVVGGPEARELVGFSFDFVNPDGNVPQALVCADQALRITRTHYPNLEQLQAQACEELDMVLPALEQGVGTLIVERLDRFISTAPRNDFRAVHVFRKDAPWLTPNIFDATDMWHTHHGLFSYPDAPHPHRLLHDLQVHTVPAEDARPTEPEATVVVEVRQSLHVLHEMNTPGATSRVMPAEEFLGEGGLLRDYLPYLMAEAESLVSALVDEGVRQ